MKSILLIISIFFLLILGPDFFLKSGFFYNLDSVFFPVYELKSFFSQTFFWHSYYLGQYLFGYEIFSKIYFLLTLLFGAFLGYKIADFIIRKFEIHNKNFSIFLKSLSIIFLISSPFIYERLMTQVGIAFGVFFIGLGFIYLLEYLEQKKDKKLYTSSLFFGLSFTAFPHSIIFIFLIGFFSFIFYFKNFSLKNIFIAFLIFLGINLNWLIGNFFLNSNSLGVSNTISTFNRANIEAFTQNSLGIGVELTSFLGYGFWGERYGHVYFPNIFSPIFILSVILIFFIIGVGAYKFFRKDRKLFYYFLTIYIFFYVLALGISSPLFSWFNDIFYNYVPYYIGMREPGKLLGMLAIINTLFFICGLYFIFKNFENKLNIEKSLFDFYLGIFIVFILINGFNPSMLFSFKGQLQILNYPNEYFKSKKFLEEKKEFKNVIFPWHSYMKCDWGNNKVFSNTYPDIINFKETIRSDNMEAGNVYSNYDNPVSKQVEKFLEKKDLEILKNLGVQNIIFQDGCGSYKNYGYLEKLDGLEKVFDEKYLKIYKLK